MSVHSFVWDSVQKILAQSEQFRMYQARGAHKPVSGLEIRHDEHRPGPRVIEKRGSFELVNPQVLLLKRLYASAAPEGKREIASALLAHLTAQNGRVVAQALVELRQTLSLHYLEQIDERFRVLWDGIADKLAVEHWTFGEDDLRHVESGMHRTRVMATAAMPKEQRGLLKNEQQAAHRMLTTLDELRKVVERVKYLRIADGLVKVQNPAIDADRRELLSRLDTLGFSKNLSTALQEIERRSSAASTTLDFKSAMDLLRTFFEEFVEEAARKASGMATTPLPTGERLSHFAPFKDYLRNVGIVGTEEADVLRVLYSYMSNQGAHALGSAPEQFHVAKTTVIEWCLMIAGRVHIYLAGTARP
jgi:hypothetical protein